MIESAASSVFCNFSTYRCLMDVDDCKEEVVKAPGSVEDVSHDCPSGSHDLVDGGPDTPVVSTEPTGTDVKGGAPSSPGNGREEGAERNDPYSKRGYTSEVFKIEVDNLPQWVGYKVKVM